MRKFIALLAIISIAIASIYFTACNNNKTGEPQAGNKEDSLKAVLERGEYLVHHVAGCLDCHSNRDFLKYSGPIVPGTEGGGGFGFDDKIAPGLIPGIVYAKNITPDPETGIGSWTDEEILRAMTQGISKKGDTLFPLMPYLNYNRMAKEDLLSIIAYIKTLKPIKNKVPDRHLMVPISMIYPATMLQPSVDNNVRPAETDTVKYGEYLATFADCATCHTPFTPQGPDMSKMFGGGLTFNLPKNKVTSANITPDSTGIGAWTEQMFMNKFIAYRDPKSYDYDPGSQNTIMPLSILAHMKDNDLKAIFAYLRTVRPVQNKVEKFPK